MKLGDMYILKENPSISCVVTKIVENLIHEYFVHVKTENKTQIYVFKDFDKLWQKKLDN
jgi:hypothetical protein